MMEGVLTLYKVSLLYYQMTTNSAVNRNLTSIIKNWNNCSECCHGLIKSCIFLYDQLTLLIWLKIKLTDNCFNFIGGGDRYLSSVFFNCFWIFFSDSAAVTIIEDLPYLFVL